MLKKFIVFFTAITIPTFAHCLTLIEAYDAALVNDPTFRAAAKEYEAGLANETIGRSALLPKLNASYYTATNYAKQWGDAYSGGPTVSNTYSYPSDYGGAFLNQPLFSLEAIAKWKQGNAQAAAAKAKFVFDSQDLLIRVLQAYLDVLYAMDQARYQAAERDAYKFQAAMNTQLRAKGEGTTTDELEALSAYQLSEAKLFDIQDLVGLNIQKLRDLTGTEIAKDEKFQNLKPVFTSVLKSKLVYSELSAHAIENNKDLSALEQQAEAARQEYRKQHAAHYPVVSIIGGLSTQRSNTPATIFQQTNQNYIGLQVNVPILTGGEISGKSDQAYANFEKSVAQKDIAKNRVLTELKQQLDILQTGERKVDALESAVKSSFELIKSAKLAVVKGEKTQLDVLLAQKLHTQSQRDLAQVKYQYLIAYLKMRQSVGELSMEDFQQVAKQFSSR